MATNFPDTSINNPNTGVGWANGDAFDDTANSGLIYYWYDPVWKTSLSSADADAKYVEVDGDTMTGDLTVPSLNSGQLAGFRNLIINGNFAIWQRGVDVTVPLSGSSDGQAYTADRWIAGQGDVRMRAASPVGSLSGFGWATLFDGQRASDYIGQLIELVRPGFLEPFFPGTQWTFSFYHDAAPDAFLYRVGFVDSSISTNPGVDNNYIEVVPSATSLTPLGNSRYSATFTIPSDMTINSTTTALQVLIEGASSKGAITGVRITGVQLEPGPVATPFEHRPIGTELALCQRYFQKISALRVPPDQGASSTGRTLTVPRTTTMRVSPTQNGTNGPGVLSVIYAGDEDYLRITGTATVEGSGFDISGFTADAEL